MTSWLTYELTTWLTPNDWLQNTKAINFVCQLFPRNGKLLLDRYQTFCVNWCCKENIKNMLFFFSGCMPTFNHVYWWLLYCGFQSLADAGKQDPGKQSFGLFVVYLRCEVHRKMRNFFLMLFLIPKCIEHIFRNSLNQLSPSLLNKKFPNKVCTYYSWTQINISPFKWFKGSLKRLFKLNTNINTL